MIETIVQAVPSALLSILGVGGLIYWMKRHIDALKGAVNTQQKTINAQAEILKDFEALNKTMKTLIETIDAPAMLKRWEDYKKFADHEKEMFQKHLVEKSAQFFKEIERIQEKNQKETMIEMSQAVQILLNLIVNFILYVPLEKRKEVLNMIELSPPFSMIRETLLQTAESAPYFSPSDVNRGLDKFRTFVSVSQSSINR